MTVPLDRSTVEELIGCDPAGLSGQVRREVAQRLRAVGQALSGEKDADADQALGILLAVADALDSDSPEAG
jgi:hypothetical protein